MFHYPIKAILPFQPPNDRTPVKCFGLMPALRKEIREECMMYKLLKKLLGKAAMGKRDHLEVLVKREITSVLMDLLRLIGILLRARHNTRFLVVANALFEEVSLAC